MEARRIYHVVWDARDHWRVMKEGFRRPHFVRDRKEDAILLAKRLAKLGPNGEVVVHEEDNRVERLLRFF